MPARKSSKDVKRVERKAARPATQGVAEAPPPPPAEEPVDWSAVMATIPTQELESEVLRRCLARPQAKNDRPPRYPVGSLPEGAVFTMPDRDIRGEVVGHTGTDVKVRIWHGASSKPECQYWSGAAMVGRPPSITPPTITAPSTTTTANLSNATTPGNDSALPPTSDPGGYRATLEHLVSRLLGLGTGLTVEKKTPSETIIRGNSKPIAYLYASKRGIRAVVPLNGGFSRVVVKSVSHENAVVESVRGRITEIAK